MSAVRFLVADSSPALHTFARKMIVGYGFEANWIHTAASAESALALANDIAPHFLLTDCFSREATTGLQLVETLRGAPARPALGLDEYGAQQRTRQSRGDARCHVSAAQAIHRAGNANRHGQSARNLGPGV